MLMRKTLVFAAVLVALSVPAQAQICTRDSLRAIVARYFQAVEKHDVSALPTAQNLRITENGLVIKPSEGFFRTGSKLHFQRSLFDTERCGAVTQAVIDETRDGATAPVILAVRLQMNGGRVSEIETIVNRKGELFFSPDGLLATRSQDWDSLLPSDQRSTREYMNDAANKYFDGFAADPKVEAPFAMPCHRWEGGVQTTAKTGNCSPKGLVLTHTHRRFPLTDVEAGITAAFVNFNQTLPDVHLFKFRNGRIELIQAVFGGRVQGPIWPDEK
jgi:hypothetical protein